MAHFIEPIEIESNLYCCKCYGTSEAGRGTKGVLTEDILFTSFPEIQTAVITNHCSPWTIMTGSLSFAQFYMPEGEISFGVSCGTTVNIDFVSSASGGTGGDTYTIRVRVFVDGGTEEDFEMDNSYDEISKAITVTGGPCGSIVRIYAQSEPDLAADFTTTATVTAEVTSIT